MSIIEFSNTEKRGDLERQLAELQEELIALDAREPKNMNSEAYETWADEHEDLEDQIDEILDALEELDG